MSTGSFSKSALCLSAALALATVHLSSPTLGAEKEPRLRVTVFLVWAWSSEGRARSESPKELEKLEEQLRKTLEKDSFRLESKPEEHVLGAGQTVSVKIPQGYEVRWTLERGEDKKLVLRQTLVNPAKKESVDVLKKSPTITHLEKIKSGSATFLICVQFEEVADAKR